MLIRKTMIHHHFDYDDGGDGDVDVVAMKIDIDADAATVVVGVAVARIVVAMVDEIVNALQSLDVSCERAVSNGQHALFYGHIPSIPCSCLCHILVEGGVAMCHVADRYENIEGR